VYQESKSRSHGESLEENWNTDVTIVVEQVQSSLLIEVVLEIVMMKGASSWVWKVVVVHQQSLRVPFQTSS
jgi:hypothetical protein